MPDVATHPQREPNRAQITSETAVPDGISNVHATGCSPLVAGSLEFSDSDSDDYCTDDEGAVVEKRVVGGKRMVGTIKARVVSRSKLVPKKAVRHVSAVSPSLNTLRSHLIIYSLAHS